MLSHFSRQAFRSQRNRCATLSKPRFFVQPAHLVAQPLHSPKITHIPKVLSPVVKNVGESATLAINNDSKRMIEEGRRVFLFGFGQSPFPVPECMVEELRANAHRKDYLPGLGLQALREAVTDSINYAHGLKRGPNTVMVGPGSKELLFLIQFCFDGDLLLPLGSWVSYAPHAQLSSSAYRYIPTTFENNFRLQPADLDEYCRTYSERQQILVLNYPSNPTSATFSHDELKDLAEVARKHNVLVLSDEIYGNISFREHVSIAEFYPEGTVILTGLSKWAGAGGWRVGMFSFPEELQWLMDAMANVASETFSCVATPIQYAGIRAYKKDCPEIRDYLDKQIAVLKAIAQYCTRVLRKTPSKLHDSEGAFYLFPDFSETEAGKSLLQAHSNGLLDGAHVVNSSDPVDIDEIFRKDLLEKTDVALASGSVFGLEKGSLMYRLSYVDFDGKIALDNAPGDLSETEGDSWVQEYCPNIAEGMQLLGDYLNKPQF